MPTLPQSQGREVINIDPLSPSVTRLVTEPELDKTKYAKTMREVLSFNHIRSLANRFIRKQSERKSSDDRQNSYDEINIFFEDYLRTAGISIKSFGMKHTASDSAFYAGLRQYATDVDNLFTKTNILWSQTTRVLRKIFSHQFAPYRTARHQMHRQKAKPERPKTSKNPTAKLEARRSVLARLAIKKPLAPTLQKELDVCSCVDVT